MMLTVPGFMHDVFEFLKVVGKKFQGSIRFLGFGALVRVTCGSEGLEFS